MAIGIARNRLSIPRVNPNPQPPRLANRVVARNMPAKGFKNPPGAGTAYKPNAGPGMIPSPATPGSTSSASAGLTSLAEGARSITTLGGLNPAPAAPAPTPTNNDPFATPAYTATNGQDPRDATYWSNLAKLQFNDRTEFAKIGEEQTKADSDYNYAVQQAIQNRQVQERQLGESAIKSNLSASGWLDRTQGEQTNAYTGERAKAQLSKEQEDHARQIARQALEQGYSIEAAGLLAEAGSRYAQALQGEAENNPGEVGAPTSPAAQAMANLSVSNPGAQKASGFSRVGVSNNQALGGNQMAKAFAQALRKGKR